MSLIFWFLIVLLCFTFLKHTVIFGGGGGSFQGLFLEVAAVTNIRLKPLFSVLFY